MGAPAECIRSKNGVQFVRSRCLQVSLGYKVVASPRVLGQMGRGENQKVTCIITVTMIRAATIVTIIRSYEAFMGRSAKNSEEGVFASKD